MCVYDVCVCVCVCVSVHMVYQLLGGYMNKDERNRGMHMLSGQPTCIPFEKISSRVVCGKVESFLVNLHPTEG